MTAFLVFWVLSGQFLDGSRIQVAPQLELRFNIFFRGARCDKGKMLAMPIWINEEGTWVDERSSDMSPEDMKGRVAGGTDTTRRVLMQFRVRNLVHIYSSR
jgi:hypothetical protein